MNMVRDFNRQLGMTIVMVTHERALAERYAQRLIFMADGKVISEELNSTGVAIAAVGETGTEGARL
jgi:ABC-type cobalamin/Fe3+-siderophores transport system ATPase subunit